jgi:predicted nucleic acid-binding protein
LIVYLNTSALIPLIVDEPSSAACRRIWDDADRVVTSRLTYVEAAAALAQALRLGRLDQAQHRTGFELLNTLWSQLTVIDVDQALVSQAAADAELWGLRGYDAVHCASARLVDDTGVVGAAGDQALLTAWRTAGITTFDTNAQMPEGNHPE